MFNRITDARVNVDNLSVRAGQISDIVQVMWAIAKQTNLLAVDAVIETARACIRGKGFAIVADVARKLAHRTSSATAEISTPVRTIQHETQAAKPVMG